MSIVWGRSVRAVDPALVVILAGVSAALHVGKLSPALPVLREALGVTLLQAGFLLSLVQFAGMTLGLAVGLAADGLGLKRSMVGGLLVLFAASLLGGWSQDAQTLLILRAVEGFGFLLVSMPAPSLIRHLVSPQRLRQTLSTPGPWLVALSFAMYSGQWLAVIGFLPTIYAQAGFAGGVTAVLTALVAAVNMVGGMIPGTLFSLAVRLAPSERTVSTTVGWMQQWAAFGQFAGPPLVAWVASGVGGWHRTWSVTGACSVAGLLLARQLGLRSQR